MRILIFNWRDLKHPMAGGAEVYTDRVASEWVKMGHSVTLFCSDVEGEPSCELTPQGYDIIRRGSRHGVYREARKYWRREGQGSFDLVIDEVNTRPFFCDKFVGSTPAITLIHQVAREVWFYEFPLVVALIGRFLLEPVWLWRLRDATVLTVSQSSKSSIARYGVRNISVVPEGYDQPEFTDLGKESEPTLVFVGRLASSKRPHHVVRAFRILKKSVPRAKLWIIGDGPQRGKVQCMAVDGVEVLGRLSESEKARRLSRAHWLVVTSVREGWAMVVTEAALLGTPTIAYEVDGLVDSVLTHGGILVKSNSRALAEALRSVCDPLLLDHKPKAGIDTGEVLEWETVACRILEVYFTSISQRGKFSVWTTSTLEIKDASLKNAES